MLLRHRLIIVGRGATGMLTAYKAVQRGYQVVVLGADTGASGAAGAMLGVLGEVTESDSLLPQRVEASKKWLEVSADIGVSLASGTTVLAERGSATESLIAGRAAEMGLRAIFGELRRVPAGPRVAISLPEERFLEPRKHLRQLQAFVAAGRGQIIEATVVAIDVVDSGVRVSTSDGGVHAGDACIVAAGAGTDQVIKAVNGGEVSPASWPLNFIADGLALVGVRGGRPMRVERGSMMPFGCGTHVVPRQDSAYFGATVRGSRRVDLPAAETTAEFDELKNDLRSDMGIEPGSSTDLVVVRGRRPVSRTGEPVPEVIVSGRCVAARGGGRNGLTLAPLVAEALLEVLEYGRQSIFVNQGLRTPTQAMEDLDIAVRDLAARGQGVAVESMEEFWNGLSEEEQTALLSPAGDLIAHEILLERAGLDRTPESGGDSL